MVLGTRKRSVPLSREKRLKRLRGVGWGREGRGGRASRSTGFEPRRRETAAASVLRTTICSRTVRGGSKGDEEGRTHAGSDASAPVIVQSKTSIPVLSATCERTTSALPLSLLWFKTHLAHSALGKSNLDIRKRRIKLDPPILQPKLARQPRRKRRPNLRRQQHAPR